MSFDRKKIRVGRVASDKMDKTVVVYIERRRSHRLYKKSIQVRKRYVAHDPENDARLGDLVKLIESRPISKTKRWKVAEILERGDIADVQPDDIQLDEDVQVAQKVDPDEHAAAVAEMAAAAAEAAATEEVAEEEPAAEEESEPEAEEPEAEAEEPEAEEESAAEEESEPEAEEPEAEESETDGVDGEEEVKE